MLKALNPLTIMERGYSIVYQNEEVANSVKSLEVGGNIQITFARWNSRSNGPNDYNE